MVYPIVVSSNPRPPAFAEKNAATVEIVASGEWRILEPVKTSGLRRFRKNPRPKQANLFRFQDNPDIGMEEPGRQLY
jgi:virulence-associated protein VagC